MKRTNVQSVLESREVCDLGRKQRSLLCQHDCFVQGLRVCAVLQDHTGCVNTVDWHCSGERLLSAGDDLKVDVWKDCFDEWKLTASYRTGHTNNIFCVKHVPHQDSSFVTAAADGDVRLTDLIQQEDRTLKPRVEVLSSNPGDMTLKIEFLPSAPMSFLTTHRDGTIRLTDLRLARRTTTAGDAPEQLVVRLPRCSFFSLCFDPTHPEMFAASSSNHFVRLYDLRMPGRPYDSGGETSGCVQLWTDPTLLQGGKLRPGEMHRNSRLHVTDVRFNMVGDLLVNYSNHDLVLFERDDPDKLDGMVCTKVIQRYTGRENEQTFLKEARFLGDDQFVTTGSDTGELFIWHAASGELVHIVTCDKVVLNGVEPNPNGLPILAVCGIDPSVKILEFRGGRGIQESDPILGQDQWTQRSFHQRMLLSPEVLLSSQVNERLAAAEQERQHGNTLFRSGNIQGARDKYTDALDCLKFCPPELSERQARDEKRNLCLLNLAQCYLQLKDWARAEMSARAALMIASSVKGWYRHCKACLNRGDLIKASKSLKKLESMELTEQEAADVVHLKAEIDARKAKQEEKEKSSSESE